jgi:heme-degrading monooxygenase HmoA
MILEHALLNVPTDKTEAFEASLRKATPLIAATPGFLGMEVRPCMERQGLYLLLVQWQRLEDHQIGFRKSDRYPKWAALLHQFYDPFPEVLHFGAPAVEAAGR